MTTLREVASQCRPVDRSAAAVDALSLASCVSVVLMAAAGATAASAGCAVVSEGLLSPSMAVKFACPLPLQNNGWWGNIFREIIFC